MKQSRQVSIWWFAFGYFAAYVPYSMLTKALSKGLFTSMHGVALSGFSLLPVTVLASTLGMFVFLTAMGWWKYASRWRLGSLDLPRPTIWTFLSAICTAGIIATTTLAYTFSGISIVFAMLLMKGGVLVIAPVVDLLTGRRVRWFSLIALLLSLGALVVAFAESGGYQMTAVAAADIIIYLASYFVRLRFMSKLAKSEDPDANRRYFVEEQMIASPLLLATLAVFALIGQGRIMGELAAGFTGIWTSPVLGWAILVGLLSQFTGIFGSLVYLDKRENTFCVPVNRSSSILAGVLASVGLALFFGQHLPSAHKMFGAGLIISAILFLTIPPMIEGRSSKAAVPFPAPLPGGEPEGEAAVAATTPAAGGHP